MHLRSIKLCTLILGIGLIASGLHGAAAAPDTPAAFVNGTVIHREDMTRAAAAERRRLAGQGISLDKARMADMPQAALHGLILRALALQECSRQGIFIPAAEVKARVRAIEAELGSRQALNRALTEAELTRDQFESNVAGDLAVARLLDTRVAPQTMVSESDIRDFYNRYPHIFRTPEQVRARHILVALPPKPTTDQVTEARLLIEDLRRRIGREEDFTGIAVKYSQDKTTANMGGDLGFFARSEMVKAFSEAAFALEPGQISDPVRTPYGFHLIQVTDRRPADRVPLDTVVPVIRRAVRQQRLDQAAQVYLEELKAGADIRIP